jgi:hypothetical protein
MSNNALFIQAMRESNLSTKDKFSITHDFRSVSNDPHGKEQLDKYYNELLNEVNRDIMALKHPAFAQFFKAI